MFDFSSRVTAKLTGATILFLLALKVLCADVESSQATPQRTLRLPNTTYPLHYNLHVVTHVHRQIFQYSGNVTIDILVKESTNEIVLHSKKLTDFVVTVIELATGEVLEDVVHSYDAAASFLVIGPRSNYQAFEAGQMFRVEVLYNGVMNTETVGLYRLSYNSTNNQTVFLAATQFEPTGARYAFPCYDEPAFKSSFSIRITHGSNYTAISNMQEDGDPIKEDDMLTTSFRKTPPMSTYLVAFVISNFEYISEEYRGVSQRVFTAPNFSNQGQRALRNAVRTLAALEDYLGISYPLSKLDHVALQKNYGAAMENWGLITYKEESLLNNNAADVHRRLKDLLTQNHEIVHQWFGNLVSPEWWTYAWMNEGFAMYFGYLLTDMIYPEYKAMEDFLTDVVEQAYSYILLRPMTFYVERDFDIRLIFDYITYQRAACVIKMFHHAFNQDTFVRGLNKFLQRYQYKVANEDHLFEALEEAVSEDTFISNRLQNSSVSEIIRSWTHSEQIAIISVMVDHVQGTITISQRPKDASSKELWWVPLNFATASHSDFEETRADVFMPPVPKITLSIVDIGLQLIPKDWLIVNKQQTGFYHVIYDDANLLSIAKQLQKDHTVIHALNRAAIFRDLYPLIENNEIHSVKVILELLKYLPHEQDSILWSYVADVVMVFDKNLHNTTTHELYQEFIRCLVAPIFHQLRKIPPTNVTNTDILARQKVMEMACDADLPACLEITRELAHGYIFGQEPLEVGSDYCGMHDSILCMGVKYLSDHEFDAILEMLSRSGQTSLQRQDLIYSLRCTRNHSHLRQYLNMLVGENSTHKIMDDDDSMAYLFYLYKSNLEARPVVWAYFEDNYKVLSRSPHFAKNFNRIAEYVPSSYRQRFRALHEKMSEERKISGSPDHVFLDSTSTRIGKKIKHSEMFLAKFQRDIHKWLSRNQPQSMSAAPIGARTGCAAP